LREKFNKQKKTDYSRSGIATKREEKKYKEPEVEYFRLNKLVAMYSKLSRREADRAIIDGRVAISKKKELNPAKQVADNEDIYLDSKLLKRPIGFTVIKYSKPRGELVTKKDDRGRKTIYHSLATKFRHFIPIGRLDYASEGLLLLTDSPRVATAMMDKDLIRVYNLKITGSITVEMINAMNDGLFIEDATKGAHACSKITSMEFKPFESFNIIKNTEKFSKIKVAISEGQNRELRRFFGYFDRTVVDLTRVAYGFIELNALPIGKNKYLEKSEYNELHKYLKKRQKNAKNNH